jgi:pseudaminic acid biosynthesis-associated methylase
MERIDLMDNKFKTEQEAFWAGEFGAEYTIRNKGEALLASNLSLFSKSLKQAGNISSCLEFGANLGMNLHALKLLYPKVSLKAVEINKSACEKLVALIGEDNVFNGSIFDFNHDVKVDLAIIKGVLIHINPEMLNVVYDKLYQASNQYIYVCEYYNPVPVSVSYRGHEDRLFKRDFAGEMLEKYPDLTLVYYGFVYRRDPAFPQDDITWFLMEKR